MISRIQRIIPDSQPFVKQNVKFLMWNAAAQITGGIKYALSTHSMLSAVGLEHPVVSGSTAYISKDIIGQIGVLVISHTKMFKKCDINTAAYGLKMMYISNSCYFLENLTPVFPSWFILAAGVSSIGKSIGMIGIGSVNAKVLNEIVPSDEIGATYVKLSAQNSAFSSIGMGLGVCVAYLVPCHTTRLICIAPVITLCNIISYKRSLECVFRKEIIE